MYLSGGATEGDSLSLSKTTQHCVHCSGFLNDISLMAVLLYSIDIYILVSQRFGCGMFVQMYCLCVMPSVQWGYGCCVCLTHCSCCIVLCGQDVFIRCL